MSVEQDDMLGRIEALEAKLAAGKSADPKRPLEHLSVSQLAQVAAAQASAGSAARAAHQETVGAEP